MVKAF